MARKSPGEGPRKRAASGGAGDGAPVDPQLLRAQAMCARRAPRVVDTGIRGLVAEMARQAQRASKGTTAAAEAWERAMPPALVAESWIESATPALLLVGVPSAAVAYAVDRALAGGALAAIRAELRAPGLRVRTRQGRAPRA
jgi:hypothetical protein